MFEDILYPKEIIEIMRSVIAGDWVGGNPEEAIDNLLAAFLQKVPDKRSWSAQVGQAVKQLGCIDCIMARLNLECLLEASEADRISIRYDRQRLLPGENHGVSCGCRACIHKILETQANGFKLTDNQKAVLDNRQTTLPDPSAPASERLIAKPEKHHPDCGCKQCVDTLLKMIEDGWNLPNNKLAIIRRATESGYTTPMLADKATTPEKAERGDHAIGKHDGEETVVYPEGQEALDDLEANFYANEKVVKQERLRPSLTPERKAELLEMLRQVGYDVMETRDKAWEKLEKLFKRRSPEQNIIGRLAYLLIFAAIQGVDARRFTSSIMPKGMIGGTIGGGITIRGLIAGR